MKLDQNSAPLLEALAAYAASSPLRFHVPGHGGGRGAPPDFASLTGGGLFALDATELPGLDDLNGPKGVISGAQCLAAGAFGSDHCFFLVNGTSQGLQALLLASGRPGQKVILPANCHRSVVGGLILAGLEPVFVRPAVVSGFNFAAGLPAGAVAGAVAGNPGACAVLCLHPTYYGAVGDLKKISGQAHAAGLPLLADEAHGSHLYFHPVFPAGALRCEADASVQSIHKTGGSLTQSSLLHLKGSRLDRDRVAAALRLLQTSSPSYVLMASLDAARRQLALEGGRLWQEVLEASAVLRSGLAAIRGIEVFGPDHLDGDGVFDCDPARLVVRVSGLGLTGRQAFAWLAARAGIYAEMADHDNVVLVLGPGISREECRRLVIGFAGLAAREGRYPLPVCPPAGDMPPARRVLGVREAWFAPSRPVDLDQAAGEVSAEWVAVYPPGIPVIVPGEEVSAGVVNYLTRARESGAAFQGPGDPELKRIRVVVA